MLAGVGCTIEDIAAALHISESTLERRRKDPKFLAALERGRGVGRVTLRRAQWKAAMAGNVTAQIWLGKQMLGQRTEPEAIRETADKVIYEWGKESSGESSNTTRSPASCDSTKPPANSKDSPDP
jgi:hypothetical protein